MPAKQAEAKQAEANQSDDRPSKGEGMNGHRDLGTSLVRTGFFTMGAGNATGSWKY